MERAFYTHEIRKSSEIMGLWEFYTLDDKDNKRKVLVPSCIETYPGLENFRGKAVYEKELEVKGNLRLVFKGISHTANVYLDDEVIAQHYGAYTPFEAIVPQLREGKHQLRVEVDSSFHEESSLHVINDYYSYGGISRPVILEQVDDIYIERILFDSYQVDGVWHAKVRLHINNLTKETLVNLRLFLNNMEEVSFEETIITGHNVVEKELTLPAVQSYELDHPILYSLKAALYLNDCCIDDLIERVGFRIVKVEGNKIMFNNKEVHIKGFNRHEDHALYGCAIPYEAMDFDIRLMLDLGSNAVRTSHYPNDERFLDLCDEYGILVWEEGHARGFNEEQMRHKNFRKQSLDCIDEMILNHYNHPTIFTWGILNECASYTEYGREIYQEQFERIKELDLTRPTTFASCHYKSDICLDLPDIVSMNIYPLWYHDSNAQDYVRDVYEWVQETKGRGKPYIVSEIGAGAVFGYHSSNKPKWSEERQAEILSEQLKAVFAVEEIAGVFIWQFCDCRVPEECFYGRPRCMNNKGIVNEYRQRKLSYDVVKGLFC